MKCSIIGQKPVWRLFRSSVASLGRRDALASEVDWGLRDVLGIAEGRWTRHGWMSFPEGMPELVRQGVASILPYTLVHRDAPTACFVIPGVCQRYATLYRVCANDMRRFTAVCRPYSRLWRSAPTVYPALAQCANRIPGFGAVCQGCRVV